MCVVSCATTTHVGNRAAPALMLRLRAAQTAVHRSVTLLVIFLGLFLLVFK